MSPLAPKYTDPNGDSVGGTSGRNLEIPTKVLTGFLFFVLGIIILLLLLLITVATAVTKSSWWTRRRRTCQRRMDHLGVNKTPLLEDRIFYYADICLEAIAFHWDESEQLVIKPPVKPKTNDQLTVDGTQLPLRFQPEKLYGATSTIHRDNMRKRSFSTLSVQPSPDGHRRASMIESLSFLSPANCMKMGKTPDDQPPRLPGYKLAYPQYEGSQSTGWNVGTLPQIDITCDQDLTGDETDGIDGSRSDREADVNSVLSISIPVRRASATNIKVVGPVLNRRASFVDACAIPALSITGDSTSSGEKDSGKDNISSGTNMLRPAQNNIVIRIKADLLVSLCQRPLEGLISVGVHEIRNIELQKQGPYSIGDLDQLTHMEQSGFEIHACLTYDGQLIKSKKSVFLQQPRNNLLPSKPQTNVEKRLSVSSTRHLMSFSRTVSGEHYLQFTIPHSKKNIGKHVLSNYGIVLFVTHKLALTDQLPADFVNQLKLIGAPELKSLQAVGDCFIADESTQTDYWTKVSFNVKCDSQCASLWNEAASHGSSRVYQWLTTT
ncbi:unnamed protein product [Echinostoma caproni]|uniref:C2 domain-containing protein n=1 Tax=Echinostoma caproni TaxID=27848 RepID=A0A183B2R7_9TREM|nr:unnamed protein product [Echinostoma caproni]